MTEKIQTVSVEQFDELLLLPENADRRLEYIAGEVIDLPNNPYSSKIAGLILTYINLYLMKNDIGHATGEGGGYQIAGERYAPDVAFISYDKQVDLTRKGYGTQPPDLAVEVISDPSNKQELRDLRKKITGYHSAGVVVWVIDPDDQTAEIHRVGSPTIVIDINGTLSAEDILPDFTLKLADVLPKSSPDA